MSNVTVLKWSGLGKGAGSTQEVLLSPHRMSRPLKLGRGVLETNKTLLLYVLTKESLTQITNPNLQARKAEHIEVRGRAHSYRVSHWPELDTHFLTPRPGPRPRPCLWPPQLRADLARQCADVTTRRSQMPVHGVARPRLRGGGTAPLRASPAQPRGAGE